MSDDPVGQDTWAALEKALREHVAAVAGGAYLTDWVVTAAAADPTDSDITQYVTASSDGPPHARIGLVRRLQLRVEQLNDD